MKILGIKIFKLNFMSFYNINIHFLSLFLILDLLNKTNFFIFIQKIIFLYNNNYKLM